MQGVISSFRRGRRTQNTSQMIVVSKGVDNKDKAAKLVGKSVKWTAPGKAKKVISGKVSAVHGGNGAVRVIFENGMPGQSLGQQVVIE